MKTKKIIVATTIYVLIAVRVSFIGWQIEEKTGRERYATAVARGMFWPATGAILGLGTLLMGSPGIYDSGYKYTPN